MQYCSLQHPTLLLSSVTSTRGYCFCFGSILLFFLELFHPLISSSILGTYWMVSSSFSILSFCLFILFMGFSRQEYWSGLPFSSPVDHILSDLSTITCPSWSLVSLSLTMLWSMWSDWLVFCDYGFNVSALWCPLATPTILLGFLLPWRWGISSLLLQQIVATAAHFIWQEKLECTGFNFDAAFPVSLKCLYITVISGFICNGCKNCYVKYISKFIVNIKMLLNIIFSILGIYKFPL